MPKLLKAVSLIFFITFVTGCGTTSGGGGVTVRTYSEDRLRVDQEIMGNAGYLVGGPKAAENTQTKKTRRVYVMEFTKNPPEDLSIPAMPPAAPSSSYTPPPAPEPTVFRPAIPPINLEEVQPEKSTETSFEEYTVEKNDTLQKISKKFYNSYSKWHKIYDVNKDKIPDPNRIKAGVILKIPH